MGNHDAPEFYVVSPPVRESDQDRAFEVGIAEPWTHDLPQVRCTVCGNTSAIDLPMPFDPPSLSPVWRHTGSTVSPSYLSESEWPTFASALSAEIGAAGRPVPPIGPGARIGKLRLRLSYREPRHFYVSYEYTLISQTALRLFRRAKVTGYDVYPVAIVEARPRQGAQPLPTYYELVVTGTAGKLAKRAHYLAVGKCAACGFATEHFFRGLFVSPSRLRGLDFFYVTELPRITILSPRVKTLLEDKGWLEWVRVRPAHEISRWPPPHEDDVRAGGDL